MHSSLQPYVRMRQSCASQVISVSLWSQDCSWYHSCDLDRLRSDIAGFLTARVHTAAGTPDQTPAVAPKRRRRPVTTAQVTTAQVAAAQVATAQVAVAPLASSTRQHRCRFKPPSLAAPQLAPCASSGRA